ncbi:MAG: acetyltransferase [Oscillospiraceae bacterium]|nr:acetyltransferase [Oscillospiraceae bacterium]
MSENVIIIGASGHGKVIADIVISAGDKLLGFIDDDEKTGDTILGFRWLGTCDRIEQLKDSSKFIIGIGNNYTRKKIADKYSYLRWYTAVHPSAAIAFNAVIGEGTAVMANAVINTSAVTGKHCIVNSGAVVEHDCRISDYVHISPNAAVAGTVKIGECTHIGIGASVINNTDIASHVIIGAGGVVIRNITERGTYVGVPVRDISKI